MKKWTGEFVPTAAPATARPQDLQLQTVGPKVDKVRPREDDDNDNDDNRKRSQQRSQARIDFLKQRVENNKIELKKMQEELRNDENEIKQLENESASPDDIILIFSFFESFYNKWEDKPDVGGGQFLHDIVYAETKLTLSHNLLAVAAKNPMLKDFAKSVSQKMTFKSNGLFYRMFAKYTQNKEMVDQYASYRSAQPPQEVIDALIQTKSFITIVPYKKTFGRGSQYYESVAQIGEKIVYGYESPME